MTPKLGVFRTGSSPADAGPIGIECKNVRHWMYPHVPELIDTIRKCLALDAVPVLIARRIPFVTFAIFSRCGFIVHQTYNQLFPAAEAAVCTENLIRIDCVTESPKRQRR